MPADSSSAAAPRRVVVSGGLGALGRSVAEVLGERGLQVGLIDRAPAQQVDGAAFVLGEVDLADAASAARAFADAALRLGGIDALVNLAGGFEWQTLEAGSVDTWDRLYATNLRTAVVACREVVPYLRTAGAGRIVNVGALAALKAGAGMGAYAASKAGVARLTEALAEELKDQRIGVNAVLPSIIDTPANRAAMPEADASRWVSTRQLAAVIAFLLSDDAEPISGACIPVAGRV